MLKESFGLQMNLREIIVSIGCCAAAVCLGFGKPARAGDLQSGNETMTSGNARCAALQPGTTARDSAGCDRVDGHVRVDLSNRLPNPSGYGHDGASPVAVRLDDSTPSRTHLRLPTDDGGFDPFPR